MKWFISDTHFGHENIIKFERTRFSTIDEHDNFVFDVIERTVKDGDELWHLGDFGILSEAIIDRWNKLKCAKKVIIRGNHDNQVGRLRLCFDEVYNEPIFLNKRVLLSHEPLPVKVDSLNVHGHLHGAVLDDSCYLNISFAEYGYQLLSEKALEKVLASIPKCSERFMFEWYRGLYKFTTERSDIVYDGDGCLNVLASQFSILERDSLYLEYKEYLDSELPDSIYSRLLVDFRLYLIMCYSKGIKPSISHFYTDGDRLISESGYLEGVIESLSKVEGLRHSKP